MSAYVWIVVMALLFFGMFFYNIFSVVNSYAYDITSEMIDESTGDFAVGASETMDILSGTWATWILMFVFGLILWALIAASRKEQYSYG